MKTMKKITALLAVLLLFASQAEAKVFNFGIKAGLNVNQLHFNKAFEKDLTDKSNSTGWELGVMTEINVPIVGLCFDASLMYARMNNNPSEGYYKDPSGNVEAFNGNNAGKNFLMIPINIKYKLLLPMVSNFFVPYVFTGPDFAFKFDKNIINDVKTRTCQVAWNVGLGIELCKHVQIGASYGFGVNNIADKVINVNAQDLKVKNNYWTVTAAWLF